MSEIQFDLSLKKKNKHICLDEISPSETESSNQVSEMQITVAH